MTESIGQNPRPTEVSNTNLNYANPYDKLINQTLGKMPPPTDPSKAPISRLSYRDIQPLGNSPFKGYRQKEMALIWALLDTISACEGAEYNSLAGTNNTFPSFEKHPNVKVLVHIKGNASERDVYTTAAGRYQFLYNTWNETIKTYPDFFERNLNGDISFSPNNQDRAALLVFRELVSPSMLEAASKSGDFTTICNKLNGIWAGLPFSKWDQHPKSLAFFSDVFKKRLNAYQTSTEQIASS